MIDSGINPHLVAVEELEKAMAEGAKFVYDMGVVVLADLHRSDRNETNN